MLRIRVFKKIEYVTMTVKYNVTSTYSPTKITNKPNDFIKMRVKVGDSYYPINKNSGYTFSTTGINEVEFTLKYESEITSGAFHSCSAITEINLANETTKIGNDAFIGCIKLTKLGGENSSIKGFEHVSQIGRNSFSACTGITDIYVHKDLESIDSMSFVQCSSVNSITVDSGNVVYDSRDNCNAIIETSTNTIIRGSNNTIIPNDVNAIGNYSFDKLSTLSSITISSSVTSIGVSAFTNCYRLKYMVIPDNVTSVGNSAFNTCSAMTSVTISTSITSLNDSVFNTCGKLKSVTISDNVTSIGVNAFNGCSGLTSVTIGNNVTKIGSNAFNGCKGLISITIPDSVTEIGSSVFSQCTSITSINIPSGITSISNNVFYGCSGLTSITVDSNNVIYDSRNNCNAVIETSSNKLISGCKNTIIPNNVESLGGYSFGGCRGLLNMIIPNSVTSIGGGAFESCTTLTSVTIGNGVTNMNSNIFRNCTSLSSISSLAISAPTIDRYTFQDINSGGTLYVPTGSSGYDTWMANSNYYLGKYNWTKVEQ